MSREWEAEYNQRQGAQNESKRDEPGRDLRAGQTYLTLTPNGLVRGRAAQTAIARRLRGWPKAEKLAEDVSHFYGEYLEYRESFGLTSSLYVIELQHEPVGLDYARIQLQLGTTRTVEALCHELLHLKIATVGYPLQERTFVPTELVPYAQHLINIQTMVSNILEHEVIFELFLELEFGRTGFLADPLKVPNYEEIARRVLKSQEYGKDLGFSWWSLEYLGHWLAARHGLGHMAQGNAENALFWGSTVHPEIVGVTRRISEIVESKALRDPGRYCEQVNSVLDLMRLPQYTGWVSIRRGSGASPRAVELPKGSAEKRETYTDERQPRFA